MKKLQWKQAVLYLAITFGGLVMVLPFYFMIITSIQPASDASAVEFNLLASNPTLQPYRDLLQGLQFFRFMGNSFVIALASVAGTVFVSTLSGYVFSKHQFPGKELLFLLILSTMLVPGAVLLVPGFLLMREFGWLNSFLPLIIPSFANAFGIFLSRQFIDTIPDDLISAARIDGCSELRIYYSIVLPLIRPLLATLAILSFLASWNKFMEALIYIFDECLFTLPLAISLLQGKFTFYENIQMAGATLAILPVLVLFFILQRHIIKSLATTGLKE